MGIFKGDLTGGFSTETSQGILKGDLTRDSQGRFNREIFDGYLAGRISREI